MFLYLYIYWSVYVIIMGSIYYEQYYGNGIDLVLNYFLICFQICLFKMFEKILVYLFDQECFEFVV